MLYEASYNLDRFEYLLYNVQCKHSRWHWVRNVQPPCAFSKELAGQKHPAAVVSEHIISPFELH